MLCVMLKQAANGQRERSFTAQVELLTKSNQSEFQSDVRLLLVSQFSTLSALLFFELIADLAASLLLSTGWFLEPCWERD